MEHYSFVSERKKLSNLTFQKLSLQHKSDWILYQRLITKLNFKFGSRLFKNCLEVLKKRHNYYNFLLPISLHLEFSRKKRSLVFFNW